MEMHQLYQLHGKFIFIKTCSYKSPSRCIRRRPKLSMRNSWNHIKSIKLCSKNRCTFSNIVVPYVLSQEDIQEIQECPPLDAIVREFNPNLVPLSFAGKDQGCVSPVFPYQWLAKWGMGQTHRSSTSKEHPVRVFIYSWIEHLSRGTDKSLVLCCRWAIPEILQ